MDLYSTHSFIHSGHFKSSTTQRRSRLQHGYCIGVSRRSAQAIAGKGLAQGPCVAARLGVEPTTLQLKVIVSTKAPPPPTFQYRCLDVVDNTVLFLDSRWRKIIMLCGFVTFKSQTNS